MELIERLDRLAIRLEKEGRCVDTITVIQAVYVIKELQKLKDGVTKAVEDMALQDQ